MSNAKTTHPDTEAHKIVAELVTDATIEALNCGLAQRNVAPEQVISVLEIPAITMARPVPAKFRVLYRAA